MTSPWVENDLLSSRTQAVANPELNDDEDLEEQIENFEGAGGDPTETIVEETPVGQGELDVIIPGQNEAMDN